MTAIRPIEFVAAPEARRAWGFLRLASGEPPDTRHNTAIEQGCHACAHAYLSFLSMYLGRG
jgi:hypothetical protein